MNRYLKEFIVRGMMFGGFGPVILGIIYFILEKCTSDFTLYGNKVFQDIISIYLLAFVHAGASVLNQIEKWGLNKSIACHFSVLYIAYSICYFINGWIKFDLKVFLIFTLIFIAVYFVIWTVVYISFKKTGKKINNIIRNK